MPDNAEAIALGLFEMLMEHEQLAADFNEKPGPEARTWLLNTYGERLMSVLARSERARIRVGQGGRGRGRHGDAETTGEDGGEARRRRAASGVTPSED